MTIGERLKELRVSLDKTQEEVARAVGTTKQNIYKYENGTITNIPLDKIEALSNYFCVNPAYLAGWTDTNSSQYYTVHSSDDRVPDMLVKFWNSLDNNGKEKLSSLICDGPDRFIASPSSPVDSILHSLTDYYYSLNDEGRKKLYDYARDLSEMEKYQKDAAQKNA